MPAQVHRFRQLNVRVSDDIFAILFVLAKKRGATQAMVIEAVLREAFNGTTYDIAAARRAWTNAQIKRRAERPQDEDERAPAWAS